MNRRVLMIEEAQRTGQQQVAVERASGKRWLAVEVCGATAVGADGGASGLAVVVSGGCRIEIGRGFDRSAPDRLEGASVAQLRTVRQLTRSAESSN